MSTKGYDTIARIVVVLVFVSTKGGVRSARIVGVPVFVNTGGSVCSARIVEAPAFVSIKGCARSARIAGDLASANMEGIRALVVIVSVTPLSAPLKDVPSTVTPLRGSTPSRTTCRVYIPTTPRR